MSLIINKTFTYQCEKSFILSDYLINHMIHKIYIVGIIIITIIIGIHYYIQECDYRLEMDKIIQLEAEYAKKQKELEFIRSQTVPCHKPNLNTPRSCYIDSGYLCSWNEMAQRCDKK